MHALLIAAALSAPLSVNTTPAGADVLAGYYRNGVEERVSCTTPCTLAIPVNSALKVRVSKPGYQVAPMPAVRWVRQGLTGRRLEPAVVTVGLEPKP